MPTAGATRRRFSAALSTRPERPRLGALFLLSSLLFSAGPGGAASSYSGGVARRGPTPHGPLHANAVVALGGGLAYSMYSFGAATARAGRGRSDADIKILNKDGKPSTNRATSLAPGEGEHVVQLTDRSFDDITGASTGGRGEWFVEFYAKWCGHCKALAPVWAKVAEDLVAHNVNVASVDASENQELAERFGISAYPAVLFFKDQRVYVYGGNADRTRERLVTFATGGYRSVDWIEVPPPMTWRQFFRRLFFNDLLRNTYMVWKRARIAAIALVTIGMCIGALGTHVATTMAAKNHIADLEEEVLAHIEALEDAQRRLKKDVGTSATKPKGE